VLASFDWYLQLWDTEMGRVLQMFTNQKVPYVVQFYPFDDQFFVMGCSDNKIVCYNAQSVISGYACKMAISPKIDKADSYIGFI
jgi:hypothetical protein